MHHPTDRITHTIFLNLFIYILLLSSLFYLNLLFNKDNFKICVQITNGFCTVMMANDSVQGKDNHISETHSNKWIGLYQHIYLFILKC